MNPITLQFLGTSFAVVGGVLGVPSILMLLICGWRLVVRLLSGNASPGSGFGDSPDALLWMLQGMTEAARWISGALTSLGQFLSQVVALLAAIGLILAAAFWFTGRGLRAGAPWARVCACFLLILTLPPSLLLTLSLPSISRVLPLALVVFCILGLHAVWAGYPPKTP